MGAVDHTRAGGLTVFGLLAACQPEPAPKPDTDEETAVEENLRPPAPVIHVEEEADGALTCVVDVTPVDPDGDPITLAFSWYTDDFSSIGDSVPAADAASRSARR